MQPQMENIMFYEICRLCLDENGYCDIIDKNGLRDDIYKCIGVKVSLWDNLPQKICENCLNIINKVTELRGKAIINDLHLRSLFDYDDEPSEECTGNEKAENSQVDRNKDTGQKHPAILTFIRVRRDLFDSSVPEESLTKEISQPDSSHVENPQADSSQVESSQADTSQADSSQADSSHADTYQADSSQIEKKQKKKKKNKPEEKFTCEKCSKVFETWKKLYLHKRVHNRNYPCPIDACGKKFATKGDLEKHIRTHTGEKPFICDVCEKGFAQRGALRLHKETVHSTRIQMEE